MNLITGYFGKPHISTNQDSMWHRGIWDSDCIIAVNGTENLSADIVSNNEIQVKSGVLQMQGRFSEIPFNTYDSLSINNGTVGENRIDLIVCHYEKDEDTKVESTTLKVIQGTPSTSTPSVPSYTEGNIDNGDLIAELPLYKVNIEGINITKVECVIEVQPPVNLARKQLFKGSILNGTITLSDKITNYRFLIIGFNQAGSQLITSSIAIFPVFYGSISYQDFISAREVVPSEQRTIVTYTGTLQYISETELKIYRTITNLYHTGNGSHSGVNVFEIKQIWGVR